jgi:hypothetical protein
MFTTFLEIYTSSFWAWATISFGIGGLLRWAYLFYTASPGGSDNNAG